MDFETLREASYYVGKDILIRVNADGSLTIRARNLDPLIISPEAANQIVVKSTPNAKEV